MSKSSKSSNFDLAAVQSALVEFGFDGWLLYDFRGLNVLALRVLGIAESDIGSRRFFYFVPAAGKPLKLVHRIEPGALDHLPGEKTVYLSWQELHAGLATLIDGCSQVAMEYSPKNSNPSPGLMLERLSWFAIAVSRWSVQAI